MALSMTFHELNMLNVLRARYTMSELHYNLLSP